MVVREQDLEVDKLLVMSIFGKWPDEELANKGIEQCNWKGHKILQDLEVEKIFYVDIEATKIMRSLKDRQWARWFDLHEMKRCDEKFLN